MSGTGRRRGTKRAPVDEAAPPPTEPAVVPAIEPEVELLDDQSISIAGGRRGRSLGRSLPGAIAGTLLIAGLAFGAALGAGDNLGPGSDRESATQAAAGGGDGAANGESEPGDGGDGYVDEPKDGPGDGSETDDLGGDHPDATEAPGDEPVDETGSEPTEKPDATKPPTTAIALGLTLKEQHPFMEWGSCSGLDFDAYKVVRSTNSAASWPLGAGDTLIAVVERGGTRKAYDGDAPHGVKVWYRVFCVRHTEDGYKVVNSSPTKGIEVPEEQAPPDPITLGLEVSPADGGKLLLDWSSCEVDGFAFYKVLRSTTNENPSYLPPHDGTDVIGVVSEMGTTQLEVWAPDGGVTAWYRVQCIGYRGDQKVLLGESAVVSVTEP